MIGLALGLAMLGAAPAVAQIKVQSWSLENGTRVLFVESRTLPILDVAVEFRAGSVFDPPDRSGLAAMTQHLARFGAGGLLEDEIARRLGEVGAQLSGRIEPDRAGFSLRTLSTMAERKQALDVFARIVQSPDFPQGAFDRERARMSSRLREEATRPGLMASQLFFAASYGGHPYSQRPHGDAEGVRSLTRDSVVDFRRRFYNGASAVVSIVGDVSHAEAIAISRRVAGSLPAGSVPAAVPPVPSLPAAQVRRVAHPSLQSHMVIGIPAASRSDPDFFALLVGNQVLGGSGFSSRLLTELREKRGYAYSVSSSLHPWLGRGPFQIMLQTPKGQADEALAVVRSVLYEFLTRGPTEKEMAGARRSLVSGFPLRIDTHRKLLEQLAMMGFHDLPTDWLAQWTRQVEQVTRDDVMRAFRRLHLDRMVTVMVGTPEDSATRPAQSASPPVAPAAASLQSSPAQASPSSLPAHSSQSPPPRLR